MDAPRRAKLDGRAVPIVRPCGSSCSSAPDPDTTPPTSTNPIDVAIASVTLAEDCGTGPTTMPPEPTQAARSMDEPAASVQAGARMSQAYGDRACEQSSIQLRVSNGTTAASAVAIEKVELLDDSGNLIGELRA